MLSVKNLPNILTISRAAVMPFFLMAFYLEGELAHYVTFAIFVFASITDYLDGYLARLWKANSVFGMVLDPIVDKLIVACALIMLVHFHRAPVVPALLIVCREITVSGLREYLAQFQLSMPVTQVAKVKTTMQFVAISMLLLTEATAGVIWFDFMAHLFLWIAAGLTIFTGYAYCQEGYKYLIIRGDHGGYR